MELNAKNTITADKVAKLLLGRDPNSHKGDYGHLLLVCGSREMPGAAVLASGGALRSGCGLVTIHLPASIAIPVVANNPSAMLSIDDADCFSTLPKAMQRFNAVGVGCGLGQNHATVEALGALLDYCHANNLPMVLDADALNIVAANSALRAKIPAESILTPHVGELHRLVGDWADEAELTVKTTSLAAELHSVVVVKGHNTAVCTPDGRILFNTTGNAGMAKGGSGDLLTGLVAGMRARGYSAIDAALVGVWLHGMAGDKAAEYYGQEAMNSSDIIEFLGESLLEIK